MESENIKNLEKLGRKDFRKEYKELFNANKNLHHQSLALGVVIGGVAGAFVSPLAGVTLLATFSTTLPYLTASTIAQDAAEKTTYSADEKIRNNSLKKSARRLTNIFMAVGVIGLATSGLSVLSHAAITGGKPESENKTYSLTSPLVRFSK